MHPSDHMLFKLDLIRDRRYPSVAVAKTTNGMVTP